MKQSQAGADQLGLPIQPHPELLWLRKDLLAQTRALQLFATTGP